MAFASSHYRFALPGLPVIGPFGDIRAFKEVPGDRQHRQAIRSAAQRLVMQLDPSRPLSRFELESAARQLLDSLKLPPAYAGWTMVAIASQFWAEQIETVPFERRLLLLPHCLRKTDACRAEYDRLGLVCRHCGACDLLALSRRAESLGYRVMIAEGSPLVMKMILSGNVDAVLGVACLDTLERTFDKILLAGIPCMAVPLVEAGCCNTSADTDEIIAMIERPFRPRPRATRTYLHLMRAAAKLFDPDELVSLLEPMPGLNSFATWTSEHPDGQSQSWQKEAILRSSANGRRRSKDDPRNVFGDLINGTEQLALEFLAAGGKHSRPFITLAMYDAALGGPATSADGASAADVPIAVKRVALAIEVFHKASLVHDDVEDDDRMRYGRPTIHQRLGPAVAINVGDFLIGLGYQLIGRQIDELGAETTAELLQLFASAHTRLAQGQGAELLWRTAENKHIEPVDALHIYSLKTAPAFEAAITAGLRSAAPIDPSLHRAVERYSRHLGVAFQILNDLDDWTDCSGADVHSDSESLIRSADRNQPTGQDQIAAPADGSMGEVVRGSDILAGRPTILWALAWERTSEAERPEILRLLDGDFGKRQRMQRAAEWFHRTDAFQRAAALVVKHHRRAAETAGAIPAEPIRFFLQFLADAILDRRPLSINDHR